MQRILSEEFINLHLEQLLDQFVDSVNCSMVRSAFRLIIDYFHGFL